MLTWEKLPGSPCFSVLQTTKSWAGPGNGATQSVQQGKIKPIGGMCLAIKMLYSYNLQELGIYNQLAKYGHNDRIVFTERRSNFLHKIIKLRQVRYFISKNQPGLQSSDPLKSSPGSHSLLVSDSVGIMSSCSLLAFPLSVCLVSSRLRCLFFSVSILNL